MTGELPGSGWGPRSGETLDGWSAGLRVLQRRGGHRSATDDLLAAWCALQAQPEARRVLDLGCGHLSVSLYLSRVLSSASFVAVEVQELSADLARRNVLLNGLGERIQVREEDLRDFPDPEPGEGFDLVTGTPPFMPIGTGLLPQDPQRAAGRFELCGGIEDYCQNAARALAPGGRVSMLMDAGQDERCRLALQNAGLELLRRVVVLPRLGKKPRFRAYIAGSVGVAEPKEPDRLEIAIRNEAGELTAEMAGIRSTLGLEPVQRASG